MWRMDQMTRRGKDFWSITPMDIEDLRRSAADDPAALAIIRQALSTDWASPTAHLFDVYHFALRLYAWLDPTKGRKASLFQSGIQTPAKVRLLNDQFGYRLLAMFLDHQLVACRLRTQAQPEMYYPTHYGLFDGRYRDLVTRLYEDLAFGPNMGDNLWVIPRKYDALAEFLDDKEPIQPPSGEDIPRD
jgi:hypothetical protein